MDLHSELNGPLAPLVRRHWRIMLAEGIVLVVLGASAILLPLAAGLAVTLVLGWLLFLAGLLGLFTTMAMRQAPGFWWSLVSSLIAMAAGVLLFLFPVGGIVSLTLILTAFLFADGVATIMLALASRVWASGSWGWMLLNGVLDLLLAIVIFALLPGAAAWLVGTIVGVDLIFGGVALIAMVTAARRRD